MWILPCESRWGSDTRRALVPAKIPAFTYSSQVARGGIYFVVWPIALNERNVMNWWTLGEKRTGKVTPSHEFRRLLCALFNHWQWSVEERRCLLILTRKYLQICQAIPSSSSLFLKGPMGGWIQWRSIWLISIVYVCEYHLVQHGMHFFQPKEFNSRPVSIHSLFTRYAKCLLLFLFINSTAYMCVFICC